MVFTRQYGANKIFDRKRAAVFKVCCEKLMIIKKATKRIKVEHHQRFDKTQRADGLLAKN